MNDAREKSRAMSHRMRVLYEDLSTDDPEVIRLANRLLTWGNAEDVEGLINSVYLAAFRDLLAVIRESSGQMQDTIKTSDKLALRKLVEFIRQDTIYEIIAMLEGEPGKKVDHLDVRDDDIIRTDSPLSVRYKYLEIQIERLANCILKHFPSEIGMGDPVQGEGACDVAVRLLQQYAERPDEDKS